jgi:hypothetical protein
MQRAGADLARERGREVADPGVDREARVGEHTGGPLARSLLLELQLRVRMHPVAETDERLSI